MILFHGSNTDIQTIDLCKSNVGKDFGFGFYLTPDYTVALNQAKRRADIDGGEPIVKWKKVTLQYFFGTERSIKLLKKL